MPQQTRVANDDGNEPIQLAPTPHRRSNKTQRSERCERVKPKKSHGFFEGHVIHIDHCRNIVTDTPASCLSPSEVANPQLKVGDCMIKKAASCYAELQSGEDAKKLGSLGFWELSRHEKPLAEAWSVKRRQKVEVRLNPTTPR